MYVQVQPPVHMGKSEVGICGFLCHSLLVLCGAGGGKVVDLYTHLCTLCMPDAHRGQKRLSGPLELEL